MSPNPARSTQLSLAEREELKQLARRMILHDPLLALKLRTGRNLSLAEAEELARKYRVPVGIVTAAIGLFTAGYCAAKAFEKGNLSAMTGSGAGNNSPGGLSLQAFWGAMIMLVFLLLICYELQHLCQFLGSE